MLHMHNVIVSTLNDLGPRVPCVFPFLCKLIVLFNQRKSQI